MYIPSSHIEKRYTNGDEFIYSTNRKKYIGPYIIINKNQFYSGEIFNTSSIRLIPISESTDFSSIIKYDIFSNFRNLDLKTFSPVLYSYSSPNERDYQNGFYKRYFSKNRTIKIGGIIEINYETFIDLRDKRGKYDYNIYDSFYIIWNLKEPLRNSEQIELLNRTYIGLKSYLKDPSQFVRS
jgi:hypothetical protein